MLWLVVALAIACAWLPRAQSIEHHSLPLTAWLKEEGARLDPMRVQESPSGYGLGLFFTTSTSTAPLPQVMIPAHVWLHMDTVGKRDGSITLSLIRIRHEMQRAGLLGRVSPDRVESLCLASALAWEYRKGRSSFWWPYLQSLPRSPGGFLSWSEQQRRSWCLVPAVAALERQFEAEVQLLIEVHQQHPPPRVDLDIMRWCLAVVNSRQFQATRRGDLYGRGGHTCVLVPFLDLANHDDDATEVVQLPLLKMGANAEWEVGLPVTNQELRVSYFPLYAPRSEQQVLQDVFNYGFNVSGWWTWPGRDTRGVGRAAEEAPEGLEE